VPQERKEVISDEVVASLRLVQAAPDRLVLCLRYPLNPDAEFTPAVETLELAVCVETLNAKGVWEPRTQVIRINPRGTGRFPVLPPQSVSEYPPLLLVETHLLEMADHAHQE
jgi:hypothetical protein